MQREKGDVGKARFLVAENDLYPSLPVTSSDHDVGLHSPVNHAAVESNKEKGRASRELHFTAAMDT